MSNAEVVSTHLYGMYHDILHDTQGRIIWDRGWHKNSIVADCHRLLASFMRGDNGTLGIQGLLVGMGRPEWDNTSQPINDPLTIIDAHPFKLGQLEMDYLDETGNVSNAPTRRLQIIATFGQHVPPWPESDTPPPPHPTTTLREFALVGQLGSTSILINYVRHPAIVKDPLSTLKRTIWLVF